MSNEPINASEKIVTPEKSVEKTTKEEPTEESQIAEEDDAFCLTFLTFSWVTPMLSRGYAAWKESKVFTTEELLKLPVDLNPDPNYEAFKREWEIEKERVKGLPPPKEGQPPHLPSVYRTCRMALGRQAYIGGFFRLMSDSFGVGMPFVLRWFVQWLSDYVNDPDGTEIWHGCLIALFLCSVQFIYAACNNFAMFFTLRSFIKARDVLTIAIYEKAMKLEATHRLSGKIVTMHSTDTFKLIEMGVFCHGLWASPLVIIASLVGLYVFIGPAGFLSLAVMIVLTPVNGVVATNLMKLRAQINGFADQRMRSVRELLQGIRIVKFMNWEKEVERKIAESRQKEVDTFVPFFSYRSVMVCMIAVIPAIVMFTVFSSAYGFGRAINADTVFPVIAMLNILRVPLAFFPLAISKVVDTNVALTRMQEFLLTEEHQNFVEELTPETEAALAEQNPDSAKPAIAFDKVSLQVYSENDRSQRTTLLHDITTTIPDGKLTIVVGATGSGKSTFINAIAGEGLIADDGGHLYRKGDIAFVAQEAWIMNTTVKGNILMGKDYDEKKYIDTVNSCQLMADLEQLSASDQTEIGERGINLSGGQKQRIAFARAVYSGIPLVLMDDPLSAVDAHVRVALFEDVIQGALSDRTRVLVTHYVEYLPNADHIIVVQDRKVAFAGTWEQLQSDTEIDVSSLAAQIEHTPSARTPGRGLLAASPSGNSAASPSEENRRVHRDTIPEPKKKNDAGVKLIGDEHQAVGQIDGRVYRWYLNNSGKFNYFLIFWGFMLWRASTVVADLFISLWAARTPVLGKTLTENQYLMWYGIWMAIAITCIVIRQIPFVAATTRAARVSHDELVTSVIRAPLSFFDTTPTGRLVNRFSKDVEAMDLVIPESLNFFYQMVLVILGALVVMCLGAPYMAIVIVLLAVVFLIVLRYYSATNRALKRLDGINRSPVLSIMSESMGGLTTLRAYDILGNFSRQHVKNVIGSSRSTNSWLCAQRWLNFRVDCVCFMANICMCGLVIVLLVTYDPQDRRDNFAFMNLAVTTSIAIGGALAFLATMSADLEAAMSSIERVEEYISAIPHERRVTYNNAVENKSLVKMEDSEQNASMTEAMSLPEGWPRSGGIEFSHVDLRYREGLPLVLKDVSVSIKSGQKVGIVGRTGSGKSTVMLALFRLIELAAGSIRIDDVNIANVDLPDLRNSITIIPQDPLLFEGTVRSNLDPFGHKSDEEIIEALRTVGMLSVVEDKIAASPVTATEETKGKDEPLSEDKEPVDTTQKKEDQKSPAAAAAGAPKEEKKEPEGPLDCVVDERGSNFSVGQRQLLCLARAIMKKSRILLLDEATASVDFESDELIQSTIRNEFSDCTVLTIAHRLSTVMDSDNILVLDGGVVQEFDHPRRLLANLEGQFHQMVMGLGEEQFQILKSRTTEPPAKEE